MRKRQFPIVGDGGGFFSWIHLDDAAAATVLALEHDGPAIYNIVDDEPAPVREWLPVLADALGAKPPRRFPRWLARLFAGEGGVMMGTEARGASNAKAKRELGWELRYPSWREGFVAAYASTAPAERHGVAVPVRGTDDVTAETEAPAVDSDASSRTTGSRGRTSSLGAGARRACRSRRASTSRWTPTRSWRSARARCG